MTDSFDVFISYSHVDSAAAVDVCTALENAGVPCWMAPRNILPSDSWSEAIIDAIDRTRVMILIFSSSSNRSPQVLREVERAVSKGARLMPVRIEEIEPTGSLAYFLSAVHWFEAFPKPFGGYLVSLVDSVQAVLRKIPRIPRIPEIVDLKPPSSGGAEEKSGENSKPVTSEPGVVVEGTAHAPQHDVIIDPDKKTGWRFSKRHAAALVGAVLCIAAIVVVFIPRSPQELKWDQLPRGTQIANMTDQPVVTFSKPDRSSPRSIHIPPGETIPDNLNDVLSQGNVSGAVWIRFPFGKGEQAYVPEASIKVRPPPP